MAEPGTWRLVGRSRRFGPFTDQGLTTVTGPTGRRRQVYRGSWSLPLRIRVARRWVHIGDPDAHGAVVVDCYQGGPDADAKMFSAQGVDYIHPLAPGEVLNNSFAAISPDGQWLLSGEWGEMSRLLVLPSPTGAEPPSTTALPLAATLSLDRPVRNVQGATFLDPTSLVCATDDPGTDLWPVARQLLHIDLDAPLDGEPRHGRVTLIGPVPLESRCHGTFEVEGVDYDRAGGDLRVVVVPPGLCRVFATVYRFRQD